jgi:hypothetical protein
MKNKTFPILVFILIVLATFTTAVCYDYSATTATQTFTGLNNATVNTTTAGVNQFITSVNSFKPVSNISRQVVVTASGRNTTTAPYIFSWKAKDNFTATLTVSNGSQNLGVGNYTLSLNASDNETWYLTYLVNTWDGKSLTFTFNKTINTNDDLINGVSHIKEGATTADFLTKNTPNAYGQSQTYKLSQTYGYFFTLSSWTTNYTINTRVVDTSGFLCGDEISSLPVTGTYIGSFLTNLAPGIGAFLIVLGVFVGIGALIYAVVIMIKGKFDGK